MLSPTSNKNIGKPSVPRSYPDTKFCSCTQSYCIITIDDSNKLNHDPQQYKRCGVVRWWKRYIRRQFKVGGCITWSERALVSTKEDPTTTRESNYMESMNVYILWAGLRCSFINPRYLRHFVSRHLGSIPLGTCISTPCGCIFLHK